MTYDHKHLVQPINEHRRVTASAAKRELDNMLSIMSTRKGGWTEDHIRLYAALTAAQCDHAEDDSMREDRP